MRRRRPGHGDDLRAPQLSRRQAPHGSWRSPVTADLIVAGTVGLGSPTLDGDDLYWLEGRPAEAGRVVLVRRAADGSIADLTPPGYNVRTRVHEYGGGAYRVDRGSIWFSNFSDQRLYRQDPGAEPRPLTEAVDRRYADVVVDRRRGLLLAVREDHTDGSREAVNTVVKLGLEGEGEEVLVSGADFYSNPRISPDGSKVSWLSWNHPHLPWDGTELWVAELSADGRVSGARQVAGGGEVSVYQPEWSPQGRLHYVSDESGWWNLYRLDPEGPVNLAPREAEFGGPQWIFRQTLYAFLPDGRIAACWVESGEDRFGVIGPEGLRQVDTGLSTIAFVAAGGSSAFLVGGSPTEPMAIIRQPLDGGRPEVIRSSFEVTVDRSWFSVPRTLEFPTEGGRTAFAFYYPPTNPEFEGPDGEKPPLLVHCHGGPTGATSSALNLETQFWTSRGWGLLDVNYGGSTGYGTAYRRRLNGGWGVVDVDDCVNAARHLVRQGHVDPARVAIAGGSAGGYTTLAALTTRDFFRAGANHFGLSDLIPFAKDTHKFESRYLDSLIGPYPEREDLYVERSPLTHVDHLNCPLIVFQGLEDRIVPPSQSEFIVDAARRKGLPVAYLAFEGEQHGFRQAANIKRALDGEMYFYSRVFDFELAEPVEPVEIENY